MGQAKKRGTFEERKAQALVRDQINRAAKSQADIERKKNRHRRDWTEQAYRNVFGIY